MTHQLNKNLQSEKSDQASLKFLQLFQVYLPNKIYKLSYWSLGIFSSKADDADHGVDDLLCRKSGFNFPTSRAFTLATLAYIHFVEFLPLADLRHRHVVDVYWLSPGKELYYKCVTKHSFSIYASCPYMALKTFSEIVHSYQKNLQTLFWSWTTSL